MKFEQRQKAIKLRKKGLPYSKILKNVGVAKSTLSIWLRAVELAPTSKRKLLIGRERSRDAAAKAKREDRINRTQEIITIAKKEFPGLLQNPLFLSGLSLYWAEGAKNSWEQVKFTNSDKFMIVLIMRWFRDICNVPEEKFRVHMHIHNLHFRKDVEKYWFSITGVSQGQFYKTYIKQSSLRQRRNILYNGTCAIIVNDKSLFRKIVGWKLGLLDYFSITTPRSLMDKTAPF